MKVTKQTLYKKEWAYRPLAMDVLVALVRDGSTKQTVESFRLKWRISLPGERDRLAQKMPRILFGGAFRKDGMKEYNGWIPLEADHLESLQEAEKLKRAVSAYPQTLFAMIGAEGRSVKFVVPYMRPDGSLPQERSAVEMFHAHAYRHALKTFEPRLGSPIELHEPAPEMGCLLSYDPDVYYNPEAFAIHLEQPVEMPDESLYQEKYEKLSPSGNAGEALYNNYRYISIQFELAFQRALSRYGNLDTKMDFKPLLTYLSKLCFGAGIEEEDCVKWTGLYLGGMLSEVEIRETVGNVYCVEKGFGGTPVCKPEQLQTLKMEEFMSRRYEFRFNIMTGAPEYRERNTFCFSFRPITERVMNSIALNAQKEGLQLWDRDVHRYVYSDRLSDYAPIEGYLRALPAWDGKDRIRPLAARIPCDNPRWEQLFYMWFLSMVAHWQGRDVQHSNSVSPLLVGGQGCGKSTFCLNLLPPELRTYYTDSIDFSKKRDAELYLTRFGLINIDEFDQVSERHQGFLKHLLQKPVVNIRKPYATQVEAVQRYASFIATSNHTDLLSDPSGSRRFICIEVLGMIDNVQPIDYAQLYAQAIAALDRNERYWMTHEEELVQMAVNEEFQQRPLYEDLFYRYYRPATHADEGEKKSAGELYLALQKKSGMKLPQGRISYFGRFLKKAVELMYNSKRGVLYLVVEK